MEREMIRILAFMAALLVAQTAFADQVRFGSTKSSANFQTAASFAKFVTNKSDLQASPAPHQSQLETVVKTAKGDLEFAVSNIAEVTWSYFGRNAHKVAQKDLRLVANLNMFRTGLLVPDDGTVKNVSDLKQHPVSGVFKPAPQLRMLMTTMLKHGGLGQADVRSIPVTGIGDGLKKYASGQHDAAIAAVGAASSIKASNTRSARWANFDKEVFEDTNYPGYEMVVLDPQPGYPLIKERTRVIQFPYVLAASTNVSDETVYKVVKAIWDSASEIEQDSFLKTFKKENMNRISNGVPWHAGAVKFYKEVGLIK